MMFSEKEYGFKRSIGAAVRPIKRKLEWQERVTCWVRYEEVIPMAIELGWTVDDSEAQMYQNGPTFRRNIKDGYQLIWKCDVFWQCADYFKNDEGIFCAQNHRPMNYLNDLLEREGINLS